MPHHHRQPHIVRHLADGNALETFRGDADDHDVAIRDSDMSPDDVRIIGELRVPEGRTDDNDRIAIDNGVLRRQKEATEAGRDPQRAPVICRDKSAVLLDAAIADANQQDVAGVVGDDRIERRGAITQSVN
jgi:hypothetical protein